MSNRHRKNKLNRTLCLVLGLPVVACAAWTPTEPPLAEHPDASAESPSEAGVADASASLPYSGPPLNGCTPSSFVDRSRPSDDRTISFGGFKASGAMSFDPPCVRIAAGQSVTWSGPFVFHPFSPGTSRARFHHGAAARREDGGTVCVSTCATTGRGDRQSSRRYAICLRFCRWHEV